MTSSAIFLGIKGAVVALDRETGRQLWKTALRGKDFVNVMLDKDRVIAATKGEIFCLDPLPARSCGITNFPVRVGV
jgi:outer membrane protein assembly factor BamB